MFITMINGSLGYFTVVLLAPSLLFGWPYKTWNTVHYSFYYMYYVDNFTTVCLNKMLLL